MARSEKGDNIAHHCYQTFRIDVFLVAFKPLYATGRYFPSAFEIAVTTGLISVLVLVYRFVVRIFPVIAIPVAGRQPALPSEISVSHRMEEVK